MSFPEWWAWCALWGFVISITTDLYPFGADWWKWWLLSAVFFLVGLRGVHS